MDGWLFCNPLSCGVRWLDDWQTLIAGVLAIFAAAAAIRQTSSYEQRRRGRRLAAARATLPLTLSSICDYAKDAGGYLIGCLMAHQAGHGEAAPAIFRGPRAVPAEAIPALERFIEASDNSEVCDALSALISDIQILDARMKEDISENAAAEPYIGEQIVLAGAIYGRASSMFDYGRGRSDQPSIFDWDKVRGSLVLIGANEGNAQVAFDRLAAFKEQHLPIGWR